MSEQQSDDRKALFDNWAKDYDRSVDDIAESQSFPFAGYDAVLSAIVDRAAPTTEMNVLDLGTGTGALVTRLAHTGCRLTATDFSQEMLARAEARLPEHTFVQADLTAPWPAELDHQFDRIVSAYVLHEFDEPTKFAILSEAASRLTARGRIILGDIAFSDDHAMNAAHERWKDTWDESEHYWIASRDLPKLAAAGLTASWHPLSPCAGVFEILVTPPA